MDSYRMLSLFAMLFIASGCTPTYLTSLSPLPDGYTSTLVLVDKRPNSQKETAFVSLNIVNCKYGSFQIGDESFEPDRVSTLKYYLENHLGSSLGQSQINLINYTAHVNRSAMLRKGASEQFYGVMADHITSQHTMGCSQDDLFGGYNSSEVPENMIPIIVVIDIEIEGKIYHGRGVTPMRSDNAGKQFPGWNEDMQEAISTAMENLVLAIEKEQYVTAGR